MAKIPGVVFLVVGIVLAIIAKYLKGLGIFVYIGYLFIAYGSARLVMKYVSKGKNEEEKLAQVNKTNGHASLHSYVGSCLSCGTPMRRINLYCHRCGTKQDQTQALPEHHGKFLHPHRQKL